MFQDEPLGMSGIYDTVSSVCYNYNNDNNDDNDDNDDNDNNDDNDDNDNNEDLIKRETY